MRTHFLSNYSKGFGRHLRLTTALASILFLPMMLAGCDSDAPSVSDDFPPLDTSVPPMVCPGDPDCPPEGPVIRTGVYIDSAVSNIAYQTPTQSGRTGSNGEYLYIHGELVTFSIGGVDLPVAPAAPVLTPLAIVDTPSVTNNVVTNIARLMLSLDDNDNPGDGILLEELAHECAQGGGIDFVVAVSAFETDPNVLNLVACATPSAPNLVDAAVAQQHLTDTLADLPVADAGPNQTVVSSVAATDTDLDGSGSTDPLVGALTYEWYIIEQPVCAIANCVPAVLVNSSTVNPVLQGMRQPGVYTVELVVTSASGGVAYDQMTVLLRKEAPTAASLFGFALISFATLSLMIRRRSAKREHLNNPDQPEGDK